MMYGYVIGCIYCHEIYNRFASDDERCTRCGKPVVGPGRTDKTTWELAVLNQLSAIEDLLITIRDNQ